MIKNPLFSCLLLIMMICVSLSSQAEQRNCSAMDVLERQLERSPDLAKKMDKIENFTQRVIRNSNEDLQRADGIITIPVVVHVIYQTNAQNISQAQINSQMQVLNDDFRRLNSDANNTWSQAADSQIEFCLASIDPNGNSTTGVTRKYYNRSEWGTNDAMKSSSNGGVDAWPTGDYLNMWICNIGGGILGYAQFPGSGSAATDGVVMSPQYFGTTGSAQAPFDGGRTTTHEVGHWLNLRHIWGDGNCNADDFVSDTPTSDAPNYGCASGHVSCSSTDMVQNYMDYSDDGCMNLFTQGQKDRMRALFAAGGFRASLLNSAGCGNSGGPVASCNDGIQNQGETGIDCGGPCTACPSNCSGTEVSITITFDNYPEETSWAITNASGATVASGGTYGNQADGSTLTITECLSGGCYDFTISDAYGDGICCSYGNGSYSVTGGGSTLASGSSFTASETTNFCVGSQPPPPPPPSCDTPSGLGTTGVTDVDGTLTWNAVSGASSYTVEIFTGGNSIYTTSVSTNSLSLTGFAAGTTYSFTVQADCGDATSATSSAHSFTTNSSGGGGNPGGGCSNVVVDAENFDSGWGIWNDGGSDSYRNNYAAYASSGSYTIRLRDNTSSSVMTTDNLNLSSFEEVTVDFHYRPVGMDSNEDFWLQVSTDGGSSYTTVETWVKGTDFNNNTNYNESVTITGTFSSTTKIRFRVDASVNNDRVYFDDVTISGCSTNTRGTLLTIVEDTVEDTVVEQLDTEEPIIKYPVDPIEVSDNFSLLSSFKLAATHDMQVYPNPAVNQVRVELNLNSLSTNVNLHIVDLMGKMVYTQNVESLAQKQLLNVNVESLSTGVYMIYVISDQQQLSKKLTIVD